MKTLLCHSATFARIEAGLKPFAAAISPVTIDDEGQLLAPWQGERLEALQPGIVYATQDIYFSKAVGAFFRLLLQAERLDWFQSSAAGIEHPALRAIGRAARFYTRSHEQSGAIAEWVLWAGLDHFQNGPLRRAAQARQDWGRMPFRELGETRWLIIGFGHIGQASAAKLRTLGAHVTGLRRSPGDHPAADRMVQPAELLGELAEADAVLLSMPWTPETENYADARFFAAMKPGALFLNVGRGALVDEAALIAGLDRGQPGHASLDVVRTEPLPAGHPLWPHPGVTLTAHISALTEAAKRRTDALFLDNLDRHLSSGDLQNLVAKSEFEEDTGAA